MVILQLFAVVGNILPAITESSIRLLESKLHIIANKSKSQDERYNRPEPRRKSLQPV